MEKEFVESVASPTEEIGLYGKSKLSIDIKYYTTTLPDLLENISSPTEENGSQDKSKLCISIKYNTELPMF